MVLFKSRHIHKDFTFIIYEAIRYRWIQLLNTKDEVIPEVREWLPYAEIQSEKNFEALCSY